MQKEETRSGLTLFSVYNDPLGYPPCIVYVQYTGGYHEYSNDLSLFLLNFSAGIF